MNVQDAVNARVSTRAFLDKPVPADTLQNIFRAAQQSPSNCNVQPWQTYVVSGAKKDQLKEKLFEELMKGQLPNPDFDWKVYYEGIHKDRQYGSAYALYNALGIERGDKQARQVAMSRNWGFFDAPHVAFFTMEKYLNIMGAVDIGIYAQTLALLMTEQGIACCMQGALGQYPDPVKEFLDLPESRGILFGMSFGYADDSADANSARTDREQLDTAVSFIS
ncbi:nitroreductase [Pseudomaricurvus alkylphenolicus]|jgi:nitroreductase|uniref:nitroreductase n=1 Tax=Pseudomaricurvus alkylphenolicus TaxID=1306991 RepID=UPI00141DC8BF|nr:nitroreductase [Pseudomaricurvus alkylphenolicus]NIB43333.1 nitroreductase [Pseudomaricurvus alkylphenolicus]